MFFTTKPLCFPVFNGTRLLNYFLLLKSEFIKHEFGLKMYAIQGSDCNPQIYLN